MIISVHNQMQNMGKSIVACNLANAAALANPDKEIWLVDTDPQLTIVGFNKTSANLPKPFRIMDTATFEAQEGSPDITIFDTQRELGKYDPDLQNDIYEQSDLILVPMVLTKGLKEYSAMAQTVDAIKARAQVKKSKVSDFRVLFNRVKSSDMDLFNERMQYANIHGCNVLKSYVSDNEAIADIFDEGSLPQYKENNAIIAEFQAVWKELSN